MSAALARENFTLNTGCLSIDSKYLKSKPDLFVASARNLAPALPQVNQYMDKRRQVSFQIMAL
jgi:hypothetical protein